MERQWVEIQMFPGRNPLIFCSQLVSIFPSWDELCFSLSKFFVLGLNQHCILNRLLCLHFKSPLGCYSCYLDGFHSVCYAHWPHQNKWLSRELDYKTVLSVDALVRVFCEPVFFFFFFLSEVVIIPWVSAVPFIRGRLEGSESFWNAQVLSLILAEWPTAFCLSSGKTHISPCGLRSLGRCGIGLGGPGVRMPVRGVLGCILKADHKPLLSARHRTRCFTCALCQWIRFPQRKRFETRCRRHQRAVFTQTKLNVDGVHLGSFSGAVAYTESKGYQWHLFWGLIT